MADSRPPSVLSFHTGHDGAVAFVSEGELVLSYEGEKDTFDRNSPLTAPAVVDALQAVPSFPDVLAIGGWFKVLPGHIGGMAGGYHGLDPGTLRPARLLGREVMAYSTSHERAHVFGSVGLSPFDPDGDLAVLVWEGVIGSFYRWRGPRQPLERIPVLQEPGARYAALFCLADPRFPDQGAIVPNDVAGKLMALAGVADDRPPEPDTVAVLESLLKVRSLHPFDKARYRQSALHNVGVTDIEVCRAARHLTSRLFDVFAAAAREHFAGAPPLVIGGGCGLNCDWNRRWADSRIFSEVFVPPCTNDSGAAIGTAVDALVQTGGSCHLAWDVYRGQGFVDDLEPIPPSWKRRKLDVDGVSEAIERGEIVAWVQGRCEIGPRALGNRSLLASATERSSRDRLNGIKRREDYRPIAPVCLEEDLGRWFDRAEPDPYMLSFRTVRHPDRLAAVTHGDGTARVQSVTMESHPSLCSLLVAHRARTGVGVLCNTSLNYSGKGFINRTTELFHYCDLVDINEVVVDEVWYRREPERPPASPASPARPGEVG